MSHRMRRFLHDQDGAIAAITAVSLVVILGMGGFAIDMSYAYSERNLLQVTADAAALSAAPELPNKNKAREMALEYVEDNMPAATHGKVLVKEDVVLGHWDPVSETWSPNVGPLNAVEVTTRRSSVNGNRLEFFLAPILGLGFLDMETSAVAYARAPTAWDVVLVQDVTGSFVDEIDEARVADQAMLDCVSNNFVDARMGLTAFTGTSTVLAELLPVGLPDHSSNYVAMEDAIFNLNACHGYPNAGFSVPEMPPCSGTHVGIGIESAIDQLDNYVPADGIVGQAIIIVADGRAQDIGYNNYDTQTLYFESKSIYYGDACGENCDKPDLELWAERAANEAEEKGYDIFVVFFDKNYDDGAAKFLEGLVRGAGQFRRTPTASELEELMFDLCTNFMELRLVM